VYLKNNWVELTKNYPINMQIIIGSYFEIESLRRDFNNAIITTDTNQVQNHYNIVTGIYTLVSGKTTKLTNIRQYPISAKLLHMIRTSGIPHGTPLCSDLNLFYKYMNDFVGTQKGQSSAINYLRICKAKWIESLQVSDSKKLEMHEKMAHSYETTLNWYV
jgi:hypothetical protein